MASHLLKSQVTASSVIETKPDGPLPAQKRSSGFDLLNGSFPASMTHSLVPNFLSSSAKLKGEGS